MKKIGIVGFACVIAAAACGGATGGKEARSPAARAGAGRACDAIPSSARPIEHAGSGSAVALARVAGRRVMFVADEDAKAILTLDLDTHETLAETPLGATPGQIYVAKDGRVVVALRDKNEIATFVASRPEAPLARTCSAATPAEPIAIAATPDDATILVSTGWGRTLAAFEAATFAPKFEAKLPREPRAVVVADDGRTAFVSHAVGSVISAIDLGGARHEVKSIEVHGTIAGERAMLDVDEEEKKRIQHPSCQGFALAKSKSVAGRIFAPQVLVEPGDPEQRPDGYGDENTSTEVPDVAVIDEGRREPLASSLVLSVEARMRGRSGDVRDVRPECLLPRAAAVDPATKSLLVTCFGIDAVIAFDATAASPFDAERRRWTVGSGPTGIAIDTEKHRAVVWSQFDRTVSTFPIGGLELADEKSTPSALRKTAAAPLKEKLPAEYALGRILFHAAGDARVSADGRACASCHPDGRDDAITWATPEGPRRTIMLAGRATKSPPYSWNGNEQTLHNHLGNTFDRLSGRGLRSIELDALVAYVSQMPAPPRTAPADKAKVERGAAVFASRETGCASCHSGPAYTDGKNHEVGSRHKADRGAAFNTPSLRFVGGTGPYFHDGRYATLGEMLRKSEGPMGGAKHLTNDDLDALEAFLGTL